MAEQVETVIVGGGHSGLAMSYWLGQAGREHLVLEQGRIAERWHSERWDSLCVLTPNWTVSLPSYGYAGLDRVGFMGKDEVAAFIAAYAQHIEAPVRTGVRVARLCQPANGAGYVLETSDGEIAAQNVVAASGAYATPVTPTVSDALPGDIFQVHSAAYRNPQQLPPGATLVVGAGASGFQIVEDLLDAGRLVYFSLGRYEARMRRYRGQDMAWWMTQTGQYDRKIEDYPQARFAPRPALTGAKGGHDLSVRKLAQDRVILLGRIQAIEGLKLAIAPDVAESVQEADARSRRTLQLVDEFIARTAIDAPPADPPEQLPDPKELSDPVLALDLRESGITSVVWATGFRYGFDWIDVSVFEPDGEPRHRRGVSAFPGLYFLGLRWQYKFKSSFIHGADEDAAYLAEQIVARAALTSR
jgi:putative flavoprotein involved in K+ transport